MAKKTTAKKFTKPAAKKKTGGLRKNSRVDASISFVKQKDGTTAVSLVTSKSCPESIAQMARLTSQLLHQHVQDNGAVPVTIGGRTVFAHRARS